MLEVMQAYFEFQKQINEHLNAESSSTQRSIIKNFEKKVFDLCVSFDTKIQSFQNELNSKNNELHAKNNELHAKNNELVKVLKQRFSISQELNQTKDSARALIKYLNSSIKASNHVIARTIIEMIVRDHVHTINFTTRKVMENFRREKHLPSNSNIVDLIKNAKTRSFWKTLTKAEQRDADLLIKWDERQLEKKNSVPTRDILIRMCEKLKPEDLVTTIPHRKFGSLSDKPERIKNSFINLYQTLSNIVHDCVVYYEEDTLPIPDLNEHGFSKADVLALATFYSINLPNMPYEIGSFAVNLPSSSAHWLNDDHWKNSLNTSITTTTTTYLAQNEKKKKRRSSDGNEENEFELAMHSQQID